MGAVQHNFHKQMVGIVHLLVGGWVGGGDIAKTEFEIQYIYFVFVNIFVSQIKWRFCFMARAERKIFLVSHPFPTRHKQLMILCSETGSFYPQACEGFHKHHLYPDRVALGDALSVSAQYLNL